MAILPGNFKVFIFEYSALIAITGVVSQHLIICFTPPDMIYLLYIGSSFSILSVCITTVCRSLITKVTLLNN